MEAAQAQSAGPNTPTLVLMAIGGLLFWGVICFGIRVLWRGVKRREQRAIARAAGLPAESEDAASQSPDSAPKSGLDLIITISVVLMWGGALVAALFGSDISRGKSPGIFVLASGMAAFGARYAFAPADTLTKAARAIGTDNVLVARCCCVVAILLGVLGCAAVLTSGGSR